MSAPTRPRAGEPGQPEPLRAAELLGALSLSTDLADGFALEKSLRTTVLASRLAAASGADEPARRTCFWAALLRFVGCTAFAHEEGRFYAAGDDIGLRRALARVDFGRPAQFVESALTSIAAHAPLPARAAALARLMSPGAPARHAVAQCEAGTTFAKALGMHDVASALAVREERWDGRGPRRVAADEALPLAARVADVADVAELFAWHHGPEAALDELRRRRGGHLEPRLVDLFVRHAGELFEGLFAPSSWDTFLEAEPRPHRAVARGDDVSRTLEVFARMVDLKSTCTLDHSGRVAALAGAAAEALGLSPTERRLSRDAGYAHDLGRVAIPNGIWDKPGPLTPYERERVRAHSQHTETILRMVPAFAELADVAAATHERGAGTGYHRRLRVDVTPAPARVLAAADVYVALTSARPHRPAFAPREAARELLSMQREGALDGRAARAVLEAAGQAPATRASWPRGLTEREVEVVRLVAIGRTNPEIGALLGVSPRTAQKHVMNVYTKVGVESRAGLALFAVEHGLLGP
jgi:HD-GYP domain-containing protein (c-di-GMP phosphodiesterase class II)